MIPSTYPHTAHCPNCERKVGLTSQDRQFLYGPWEILFNGASWRLDQTIKFGIPPC